MPSMNLYYNQADYQDHSKIALTDILEMPFYKFEIFIERLNERNEEKVKEEKKMNDEYMKNQQSTTSSFKTPSLKSFKPPKLK